ncbi:glycerate kinase [Halorubrum sp. 48-1-W]|uniref:glycerate kinase type-2 family protein n=1 Tax=Halorubrum sp. 48-1-W TaxID=2249761 RepID=UPI000DCF50F8|nr:DUF4147 domain-containing protein [Halorubrum sp. 48-1-W]RAW45270.1 glycerate kinase [Halorubrum sp. 48-1-W]
MTDVTFRDRERVARTPPHGVALDCLAAGIEAALPANVVADAVSVADGTLRIEAVDGGADADDGGTGADDGGADADDGGTGSYDLGAYESVRVVGAGKAADGVATAVVDRLRGGLGDRRAGRPDDRFAGSLGDRFDGGVVVTDDPDRSGETGPFELLPGDHPLPTERGVEHARRVVDAAAAGGPDDLVLAVVTGGASALLAVPADPIDVDDLRELTDALLASGASIDEINAVRKHCSAVKGGQLARAAAPATVVTLAVSDVVGDDLAVIGSGPTVPDPSTYDDALATLKRYGIDAPATVRERLRAGADGDRPETPVAGDPAFERARTFVIGNARTALDAAATAAADRGYDPAVVADDVVGEARDAGREHVAFAEACAVDGRPVAPPAVLLTGGETTVTLADGTGDDPVEPGSGGPNAEFVTSAGIELEREGVVVASVDTDGIDGASDACGGIVDAVTLPTPAARDALSRHDVAPLLDEADALLRTGPTGTNVNDLRAVVVTERSK